MNYLNNYGITEEQIKNIEVVLKEHDVSIDIFKYDPEKIKSILDLFVSIGVKNIYKIIITNPSMFCDTVNSIKRRIDKYENKEELARLLNENVCNLQLVNLM